MKTMNKCMLFMVALLIALPSAVNAGPVNIENESEQVDTVAYRTYTGQVVDADSNDPLPFATVEAVGLNIATVSNIDGDFTLKIPKSEDATLIKVTYVGYTNATAELAGMDGTTSMLIELDPASVNLQQVTIRPNDAYSIINMVLNKIPQNYSTEDMMLKAFYRETVKKGRNYVAISEAVVDIYKSPYNSDFRYDQVKLIQGRKSADVQKMDTVLFKMQGGPVTSLMLDIIKNPYILLSEEPQKVYNFEIEDVISLNDRLHYVMAFNQKQHVLTPFYRGKLYIDVDNLAISEAEFELNMANKYEAASMFIRKKPIGMSVLPEKAVYRTKYTIDGNKWYFSYARAEVKFDVDWDKKLFNTSYYTMSEIAITDKSEKDVERFANRDRFKRSQVLESLVYVFFDQDFWGSYNVIEPDQSIESAIRKLNRKHLRRTSPSPAP
jgi:hypothetical protein